MNESLRSVLPHAFPNIYLDAVVNLNVGLTKIAKLRGDSSHDSTTPDNQKEGDAQELWNVVVGSNEIGFLAAFYSAFGLTGEGQAAGNADGC